MIAKPVDASGSWNYMQFLRDDDLGAAFLQAYDRLGWFGGFANLNF